MLSDSAGVFAGPGEVELDLLPQTGDKKRLPYW